MHRASEVDLLLNPLSRWVTKSLFTAATQNNQPWLGTSDPFAKELKNQQRIITDDGAKFVCSMNEGFQKWMKYGGALVLRSWFKSFYSQLHRVYKYINKSFAYCLNRTTSPTLFSRVCGVFFLTVHALLQGPSYRQFNTCYSTEGWWWKLWLKTAMQKTMDVNT